MAEGAGAHKAKTSRDVRRHLPPPMSVAECSQMYRARAAQDLAGLEAHISGNSLASLLFVKGAPSPANRCGEEPLSGPDGEAIRKALPRMGFDPADICVCFVTGFDGQTLDASQVEALVYAIDPIVIVTLDREALSALAEALRMPDIRPGGECVAPIGCQVVSIDGFESLLATQEGKRVAWSQLRRAKRPGEPF